MDEKQLDALDNDEYTDGEDSEEQETKSYECVACKKIFKSEGSLLAHDKSKRHKQAVWKLKKKMKKENTELGLSAEASEEEDEESGDDGDVYGGGGGVEDSPVMDSPVMEAPNKEGTHDKSQKSSISNGEDHEETEIVEKQHQDDEDEEEDEGDEEEDEDEEEDSDHVPVSKFHSRVFGDPSDITDSLATTSLDNSDHEDGLSAKKPQPKVGAAKAKREKKKAAAAAASGTGTPVNEVLTSLRTSLSIQV